MKTVAEMAIFRLLSHFKERQLNKWSSQQRFVSLNCGSVQRFTFILTVLTFEFEVISLVD